MLGAETPEVHKAGPAPPLMAWKDCRALRFCQELCGARHHRPLQAAADGYNRLPGSLRTAGSPPQVDLASYADIF